MQASKQWTPPGGTLGQILAETRERLHTIDRVAPTAPTGQGRARFRQALTGRTVRLIAEVKRRSPSRGPLNAELDTATQVRRFERGGAAALSILTESSRFGGSLQDLREAASGTALPLLRKDFLIDPAQVAEAARHGASAVLLIARALPPDDLASMHRETARWGLDALVEVRSESELALAIDIGASVIGVNARDLETLEVDEGVPERLIPRIPPGVVAIWESGVSDRLAVERAAAAGADAVLLGSALSLSGDPEALLRSMADVPSVPRRGDG